MRTALVIAVSAIFIFGAAHIINYLAVERNGVPFEYDEEFYEDHGYDIYENIYGFAGEERSAEILTYQSIALVISAVVMLCGNKAASYDEPDFNNSFRILLISFACNAAAMIFSPGIFTSILVAAAEILQMFAMLYLIKANISVMKDTNEGEAVKRRGKIALLVYIPLKMLCIAAHTVRQFSGFSLTLFIIECILAVGSLLVLAIYLGGNSAD